MRESSGTRVLLVDDDPAVRNLLSTRLRDAGFVPESAEDGIDGLAKLWAIYPQVIISDIELPRLSGIDFIALVRQHFPSIPIIVFSGSSPSVLPPDVQPDRWFDKLRFRISELLQAVQELSQTNSEFN